MTFFCWHIVRAMFSATFQVFIPKESVILANSFQVAIVQLPGLKPKELIILGWSFGNQMPPREGLHPKTELVRKLILSCNCPLSVVCNLRIQLEFAVHTGPKQGDHHPKPIQHANLYIEK